MKFFRKYIIILAASISIFCSCEDFLEVGNQGKVDIPTIFADVPSMKATVNGMYSALFSFYDSQFSKYGDLTADMVDITKTNDSNYALFNFDLTRYDASGPVGFIWRKGYESIANANNIIDNVTSLLNKFPEEKNEINRCYAEALYTRAFCHFALNLVYAQNYSYTDDASHMGIPVITKPATVNDNPKRNTAKEVYVQVIADLKKAIQLFDLIDDVSSFYISSDAVKALLSRVYLYKGEWQNCIDISSELIADRDISYGDEYLNIFSLANNTNEVIFKFSGEDKGSTLYGTFHEGNVVCSDKFINLISKTISVNETNLAGDPVTNEYPDIRNNFIKAIESLKYSNKYEYSDGEQEIINPIVSRMSEIYFNRAEAYLSLETPNITLAKKDIAKLISRNYDLDPAKINISDDKTALLSLIDEQKSIEFFAEGHRFFDISRHHQNLVRDNKSNSSTKELTYPDYRYVLQISEKETNANRNIEQNPSSNK